MSLDIVEELVESVDRGREGKSQGYSMGLPKLEEVVDGVCKETYYLLGAESGVGKSSFMLYSFIYRPLMEHLDDNKFKISLFSLEMSGRLILAKLLCTYMFETYGVRISLKQLLSAKKGYILSDENYLLFKQSLPWLRKVSSILTIYDKSASANSIYSKLLKELEERGTFTETENRKIYTPDDPDLIHLVVLDHIARVFPANGNTLKQEMDLASKYLYSLKNRCGITPVVIQQLNRNIQSMDRRKEAMVVPLSSDFKDSNSTIEDAEIILAIFSPNKAKLNTHKGYDIKQMGDKFRSIFCLKGRYGEADVEDFIYYDGVVNKWVEMPRASEINDFSRFENPLWYEQDVQGIEYVDTDTTIKSKFTL